MAYSKLFSSIVSSSLWSEPDSTRILFITLLALSDRNGIVYGSKSGLARIACIDPDDEDEAFANLTNPDPESGDLMRNPENQGRRIERVPEGFRIINFEYYRGLRNEDDRREQNREAQRRFKAKVSQGKPGSASISPVQPRSAHTEAEAEADSEAEKYNNNNYLDVAERATGSAGKNFSGNGHGEAHPEPPADGPKRSKRRANVGSVVVVDEQSSRGTGGHAPKEG